MAIKEIKINKFNTGQAQGYFSTDSIKPYKLQNLFADAVTNILTPSFTPTLNPRSYATSNKITHFVNGSANTFGAGDNGSGVLKIFKASPPLDDTSSAWSTGAASVVTGRNTGGNKSLSYYKYGTTDPALYGIDGGGVCWKLTVPSDVPTTLTASFGTASDATAPTSNGVVAKDDNLYIACANDVHRISSTFQDSVLTIPTKYTIVQLVPYGNYLALVCRNTSTIGSSALFLWDLISDDVTESHFFSDEVMVGAGYVGSTLYMFTTNGGSLGVALNPHITVWGYNGGIPQYLYRFDLDGTFPYATFTPKTGVIVPATTTGVSTSSGNCIYVPFRYSSEGTYYTGFFVLDGNGTQPMFYFDQVQSNGTGNVEVYQIIFWNDTYAYSSYDGNEYNIYMSPSLRTRSTGVFESTIFTGAESDKDKQLISLSVFSRPLPASATFTLKYRINNATSWTTIGTASTTGDMFRDFLTVESTGGNFDIFKEVQFRIESTGGAEITGFKFKYNEFGNVYER